MEKERELELEEKLNEQRRVLEGEHAEALRGKDEMRLEDCGPDSFCSTCQAHRGLPFPLPAHLWSLSSCHFRTRVCRVLRLVLLGI